MEPPEGVVGVYLGFQIIALGQGDAGRKVPAPWVLEVEGT